MSSFVIGGLAGIGAVSCVHPMDLIKVRLQTSGVNGSEKFNGFIHCVTTVAKREGFFALYRGLSANILRQITYTTTRMGMFTFLGELYTASYGDQNFWSRLTIGLLAGGVGAFVGTPADVALIRMTADGSLPKDQRRDYKNVVDALMRIRKEEGSLALWRGWKATVGRAMVVNGVGLGSYSQAKSSLIKNYGMPDALMAHFIASMISGLLATAVSMPIDVCKTRLQNMKSVDGKPQFKGFFDIFQNVLKHEGVRALWKGTVPYYTRVAPLTVLTFVFFEQLSNFYNHYILGSDKSSGL